jgi:gamma-glutamylcyclotransferase (GGCT)/AIG2-like uncharacterized protein YtfP
MKGKYYFAYGSNMSLEQMKERCPHSTFIKIVYLEGYKFVYDGYSKYRQGAVANIVESKRDVVWGALFDITSEDEENLNRCEGYSRVYNKKYVTVKDTEGNEYKAFTYFRKTHELGTPSAKYKEIILESAKKLGLPKDYIDKYLK